MRKSAINCRNLLPDEWTERLQKGSSTKCVIFNNKNDEIIIEKEIKLVRLYTQTYILKNPSLIPSVPFPLCACTFTST